MNFTLDTLYCQEPNDISVSTKEVLYHCVSVSLHQAEVGYLVKVTKIGKMDGKQQSAF